jgi:hypothetical protein
VAYPIPYFFGSYIDNPERFYGRVEEQNRILGSIRQAEYGHYWHLGIVGDYRIGKSSLLKILDRRIPQETRSISVSIDLSRVTQETFFEEIVFRTGQEISSTLDIQIDPSRVLRTRRDYHPHLSPDLLDKLLDSYLLRVRQSGHYRSVVIMVDEFSVISTWSNSSKILRQWRAMAQHQKGYSFIVASSYPLSEISEDLWSPFFNIFKITRLGVLKKQEAIQLIVDPGKRAGLEFTDDAVEHICGLSGCNPYYIQVICTAICECLFEKRNINLVDKELVDLCINNSVAYLDEHLLTVWRKLASPEKRMLLEFARSNDQVYPKDFDGLVFDCRPDHIVPVGINSDCGNNDNMVLSGILLHWLRSHHLHPSPGKN